MKKYEITKRYYEVKRCISVKCDCCGIYAEKHRCNLSRDLNWEHEDSTGKGTGAFRLIRETCTNGPNGRWSEKTKDICMNCGELIFDNLEKIIRLLQRDIDRQINERTNK